MTAIEQANQAAQYAFIIKGTVLILAVLAGAASLWMGYSLFVKGVDTPSDVEGKWKTARIKLARIGPGIFFAGFGAFLIYNSMRSPLTNEVQIQGQATAGAEVDATAPLNPILAVPAAPSVPVPASNTPAEEARVEPPTPERLSAASIPSVGGGEGRIPTPSHPPLEQGGAVVSINTRAHEAPSWGLDAKLPNQPLSSSYNAHLRQEMRDQAGGGSIYKVN